MKQLKIGIVEDDFIIAESIVIALEQCGYETTTVAQNFDQAIKMINDEQPDLVLLDITIKGDKDGVAVAKKINELFHLPFIFLTAYSDSNTLARVKETNPYAYIVKPFHEQDLYTAIEIAINNFQNKQAINAKKEYFNESIFIKQQDAYFKVAVNDIVYLESDNVYVTLYTIQSQKHVVRNKLDTILTEIANAHFVKINRSYAINTQYLKAIKSESVLVGQFEVPLQKAYRDELLKRFKTI